MRDMLKSVNTTILYIVIGVILAFAINQGLALGLSTDIPIVAVESDSMIPTFHRGDILVLQGAQEDELKVTDIIVFQPSGQEIPVVHRIIKINDDGTFQTKGDANAGQLSFEKSVKFSQIHGKVMLIIPYFGWVKIGLTEYVMPNILLVILAIVIIYVLYMTIVKPPRRR